MVRRMAGALGVLAAVVAAVGPASAGLIGDVAEGPGPRLKSLIAAYCDAEMRDDPLDATFRGDHRFDDRLPDASPAGHDAQTARRRATLAALEDIEPAGLTADEQVERELLQHTLESRLAYEPFRAHLIPLTHLIGLPLDFAENAAFQPAATLGDFENYLTRLRAFPRAVDGLIATMRKGMAANRVPPRATMVRLLPQLRALADPAAELSPLYALVARVPADWTDAERGAVAERVRGAIATDAGPAFARLAGFIEREYLPSCRDSVGLCATPDGAAYYAQRVRDFTTTNLTPEEVHAIGLAEVARAREAMDKVRGSVGFAGDLKAFLADMRTNPRWRNTSAAAMLARYRAILREIDAKLPELFGHLPQTDYAIRPVDAYKAKTASSGSYSSAPADGSRPAYFHVNTSDPEGRPTYSMQALAYHEAVPGHHLQHSLAHEAPGRSAFRTHCNFTAFSEGWALYCERLPAEIGLYVDPYAEFGRLELDAWRSARLVVDTGIHAKGWSREEAIAFIESVSASSRPEIEREVDRYIAWPAQALAYKIGELKIRELRAKAQRRLGAAFDIRAFHDRLLSEGSLPLTMLERHMGEELAPALARDQRK